MASASDVSVEFPCLLDPWLLTLLQPTAADFLQAAGITLTSCMPGMVGSPEILGHDEALCSRPGAGILSSSSQG